MCFLPALNCSSSSLPDSAPIGRNSYCHHSQFKSRQPTYTIGKLLHCSASWLARSKGRSRFSIDAPPKFYNRTYILDHSGEQCSQSPGQCPKRLCFPRDCSYSFTSLQTSLTVTTCVYQILIISRVTSLLRPPPAPRLIRPGDLVLRRSLRRFRLRVRFLPSLFFLLGPWYKVKCGEHVGRITHF